MNHTQPETSNQKPVTFTTMQKIKANIPKPTSNYFMYVAPAPTPQQTNKFELSESREIVELETNGEIIKAERNDFYEEPFRFMSNYLCKLAYGFSQAEMKTWLKQRFPDLQPDSKIAFYLFKKVDSTVKEPVPAGVGLPA